MSQSIHRCPHCDKEVQEQWEFCPYCGKSMRVASPPAPRAPLAPIAPEPPDPRTLTGSCSVIAKRPLPADLSAIGLEVARIANRALADVTSTMHLAKGIVVRGVDAEAARHVKAAIESEALPIVLIPDEQWVSFEATRIIRGVEVAGGELRGETAGESGGWEPARLRLDELLCAAAVRIRSERRELSGADSAAEAEVRQWLDQSVLGRMTMRRVFKRTKVREPVSVIALSHSYLVSLITRERVRYDVLEQSLDFELMQTVPADFGRWSALAQAIAGGVPDLPANRGIRLLCDGERERGWEEITFVSRSGAARYWEWVLQLAARGYEVTL